MDSFIPTVGKQIGREPTEEEGLCAYRAMPQFKDAVGDEGDGSSLALLSTSLLLARAAEETTLQAITKGIGLRAARLRQVLPLDPPFCVLRLPAMCYRPWSLSRSMRF